MIDVCREKGLDITPPGYGAIVLTELPEEGVEGVYYIVDGVMYEWDGEQFVSECGGSCCQDDLKAYIDGSITEVVVPGTAEKVRDYAFDSAYGITITSVVVEDGPTSIGEYAFETSEGEGTLVSVDLPPSIEEIGEGVFYDQNNLVSFTIRATVPPALADDVFEGTSEDLIIYVPAGSVDVYKAAEGWSDFADRIQAYENERTYSENNCAACETYGKIIDGSIINLIVPDGVTIIVGPSLADTQENLDTVVIPSSVTEIGESAFYNTPLKNIIIQGAVEIIGSGAFRNTQIERIDIPDTITQIGNFAFAECAQLMEVIVRATTPPTIDIYTFKDVPANCVIKVPAASVSAYQSAQYWSARSAYIQAI